MGILLVIPDYHFFLVPTCSVFSVGRIVAWPTSTATPYV